jgi:hypothetical protein
MNIPTKLSGDVFVIGCNSPNDEQLKLLSDIGKMPLGFDGEFSPVFLLPKSDTGEYPLSIEAYRVDPELVPSIEPLVSNGGVIILLSPHSVDHPTFEGIVALAQSPKVKLLVHEGVSPPLILNESIVPRTFKSTEDLKPLLYSALQQVRASQNGRRKSLIESGPITKTDRKILKIFQIASFYPEYLEMLYRERPELQTASFSVQNRVLIEGYFSGAHMIAPYLKEFGYEGNLIVANAPYAQAAWCRENGHLDAMGPDWNKEIVRRQINHYQPDILYTVDPLDFDSRFFRTVSFKPSFIAGWRAAPIPAGTDWSMFDLILSNLSGVRRIALDLGAKAAEEFSPGFPSEVLKSFDNSLERYDVSFSGQWGWGHEKRNGYMDQVARECVAIKDFTCVFFMGGEVQKISPAVQKYNFGPRYGIPYYESLRAGKICLDARGSAFTCVHPLTGEKIDIAGAEGGSMRLIEATGVGAFLLCEEHEGMDRYFEPGIDVAVFKGEADLMEKIRYYLGRRDERAAIAERGHQKCIELHRMQARAARFDELIRKKIQGIGSTGSPTEKIRVSPTELIFQASEALKQGRAESALKLLSQVPSGRLRDLEYVRGLSLAELGRWHEAEAAMLTELSHFPERQEVRSVLEQIVQPSLRAKG